MSQRLTPAARRALRRVRRSEGGRAPQIFTRRWNVCAVTHSTNAGAGAARVWAWQAHVSLPNLGSDYQRTGIDCWAGSRSEAIRLAGAPRTRWVCTREAATDEVWSFAVPFRPAPPLRTQEEIDATAPSACSACGAEHGEWCRVGCPGWSSIIDGTGPVPSIEFVGMVRADSPGFLAAMEAEFAVNAANYAVDFCDASARWCPVHGGGATSGAATRAEVVAERRPDGDAPEVE